MYKAIIYLRVSSDAQIDNTSLDEQLRVCKEYCERENFEVIKVFREEGASAKTSNRPILQEALTYCASSKDIAYFVVYKLDRFSRSVEYHHQIKALLSQYNVSVISATEPINPSPAGNLFENIIASFAQFDNEVRSERTRNGMRARIKEGLWPFIPPVGYVKDLSTGTDKIKPMIPDPDRFDTIKRIWQLFIYEHKKPYEILKWLSSIGFKLKTGKPMTEQTLSRLLRNKIYAGYIISKDIEVKAQHLPMITLNEFYRAQSLIDKHDIYRVANPVFDFNQIIVCSHCKKYMTGGLAKRKFGYYRCYNKNCKQKDNIKKELVDYAFRSFLSDRQIDEELVAYFKKIVSEVYEEAIKRHLKASKPLKDILTKLQSQLENIDELLETGVYDIEKHRERSAKIRLQIIETEDKLKSTDIDRFQAEVQINLALTFMSDLNRAWQEMTIEQKRQFGHAVFPKGIICIDNHIATTGNVDILTIISKNGDKNSPGTPNVTEFELVLSTIIELGSILKGIRYSV
jgi:site-specific DNA recombinase